MKRILSLIFCLIAVATEVPSKQMDIEHYHQHSSIQWCWAQSSLYRIEIEGNETILDLGCGDGKISAYLARLVPDGSVVGLDPLQHAIEFASDRYGVSNLTFAQGDAALYSPPEGYDLITAFCTSTPDCGSC